jgi:hypothetical protein
MLGANGDHNNLALAGLLVIRRADLGTAVLKISGVP